MIHAVNSLAVNFVNKCFCVEVSRKCSIVSWLHALKAYGSYLSFRIYLATNGGYCALGSIPLSHTPNYHVSCSLAWKAIF